MKTSRVVTKSENFEGNITAVVGNVASLVYMLVPPRVVMKLKAFGNYLGVVANWSHVRWDFFKNGVPIYPYFAIRSQIGYGADRQPIENITIEGGCLFEIRGTQESGVADVMGVSLEWDMEYKS
jgi:hypothetical protein